MKRPRITLARLMAVVAVVAVEFAAFVIALDSEYAELALGLAPTALACQIGLLCAVRTGGRSRAFWTGFVLFGCAMMATLAWAYAGSKPGASFTAAAVNDVWVSYDELAQGVISTVPGVPHWFWGDVGVVVISALPQLAAACAGGVLVLLIRLVMRRFFRTRAPDSSREEGRASLLPSSEPLPPSSNRVPIGSRS